MDVAVGEREALEDVELVDHPVVAKREEVGEALYDGVHGGDGEGGATDAHPEHAPERTDTHRHAQGGHQSEDEDAEAYTAEKEAAAQAAQERKQAEEDAKKAAEEAEASGSEQTGGNKVTKYAATFLGVLALVGLVAGGGIYTFMKQKQKKQAEKEALDPDANYTEDKGDFEIPVEDEPEETGEEDTEPI